MSLGEGTLFGRTTTTQTQQSSSSTMGVISGVSKSASFDAPPRQIPRRNLTEAFEELYVQPKNDVAATPATKEQATVESKSKVSEVSPTGVADLVPADADSESRDTQDTASDAHVTTTTTTATATTTTTQDESASTGSEELPHFQLHASLQRDLSQALVNRVSFYGVIHDINKEANSMATCDTSSFARSVCADDADEEEFSPLVVAVNGAPSRPRPASSLMDTAVIDEEKWLLAAIESRGEDESRSVAACPPTFLQAMGEREYDSPLSSMETSRTQLWKPSRSWWEAKSGKNPWIEPTSHNKRWRYLWPLIHYHKFLAKCIKKLKRNGVDVKTSVSPVAVFLREDVCAVSDHLASVSLYTSEEWMDCLVHFNGWTDHSPAAEKRLQVLVSRLKLRPLAEPGDVDSPLLRSQVDEHFLRAMASAREQMTNGGFQQERANLHKSAAQQAAGENSSRKSASAGRNKIPLHPQRVTSAAYHGTSNQTPTESAYGKGGYQQHSGWWANGWPQYAYCDETSVQSALSGDSYLQGAYYGATPDQPDYYYGQAGATPGAYYGAPPDRSDYYYGHAGAYGMTPEQYIAEGWMPPPPSGGGDPNAAYGTQTSEGSSSTYPPGTPSTHSSPHAKYNPYQYSPSHSRVTPPEQTQTPHKSPYPGVPSSPYWGHLDQATLGIAGVVTPHKPPPHPETPQRAGHSPSDDGNQQAEGDGSDSRGVAANNARPLLMNYYGQHHHYGAREGYAPPSPATQFMMSSSPSPYSHHHGYYGYSPHRNGWIHGLPPNARRPSSEKKETPPSGTDDISPPRVRKVTTNAAVSSGGRDSPGVLNSTATIATIAESESIATTSPS